MTFHPILIKDVLTVSTKELQGLISKGNGKIFSSERKMVIELPETSSNVTYQTTLEISKCLKDVDKLYVGLELKGDEYALFSGNVSFEVKSADHSVKSYNVINYPRHQRWPKTLCALTDALNPEKNFFIDGKLTLHVQGMIFVKPYYDEHETHLAKKLRKRDDRDFVIAVGKEDGPKTEIKIHKLVLMAGSPVFDAMLQTDMKEKAQNRLDIIDFDVEVVQAAVEYFYDRNTFHSINLEHLIGLLHFVDKYQIYDAKNKIQIFLLSFIYPDTVCQITNASITSNSRLLKKACIQSLKLYIREKVPFDDIDSLDKDFAAEFFRSLSLPEEEEDSSDDDLDNEYSSDDDVDMPEAV